MKQTTMATSTEVEGMTVDVPPELEDQLLQSDLPSDENNTPAVEHEQTPQESTQDDTADAELSTREERRVSKLIPQLKEQTAKAKTLEAENSALKELIDKAKAGVNTPQPSLDGLNQNAGFGIPPWEQGPIIPEPGSEITPDQYKRDLLGAADQLTDMKLAQYQNKVHSYETFKDDVSYITNTYHPGPEAEKEIAQLYQKATGGDPLSSRVRFKEFAEPILKLHQAGQFNGKTEVTQELLKQEQESAIPPTGTTVKRSSNSNPDGMSLDEKEAWLKANGLWDE
jgi:hypothetical protein